MVMINIAGVPTLCQNLRCLLLGDTLNLLEYSAWCVGDRFDCIVSPINNQLYVSLGQTCYALGIVKNVQLKCIHTSLLPMRSVA